MDLVRRPHNKNTGYNRGAVTHAVATPALLARLIASGKLINSAFFAPSVQS